MSPTDSLIHGPERSRNESTGSRPRSTDSTRRSSAMRRNLPYLHSEHIYSLDPLTTIIRRVLNRFRRRSKPFQIDDHIRATVITEGLGYPKVDHTNVVTFD